MSYLIGNKVFGIFKLLKRFSFDKLSWGIDIRHFSLITSFCFGHHVKVGLLFHPLDSVAAPKVCFLSSRIRKRMMFLNSYHDTRLSLLPTTAEVIVCNRSWPKYFQNDGSWSCFSTSWPARSCWLWDKRCYPSRHTTLTSSSSWWTTFYCPGSSQLGRNMTTLMTS